MQARNSMNPRAVTQLDAVQPFSGGEGGIRTLEGSFTPLLA